MTPDNAWRYHSVIFGGSIVIFFFFRMTDINNDMGGGGCGGVGGGQSWGSTIGPVLCVCVNTLDLNVIELF